MTWKDLKRFISDNNYNNQEKEEEIKLQSQRFDIFKGLRFWISDINEHRQRDIATNGTCCFNHVMIQTKNRRKINKLLIGVLSCMPACYVTLSKRLKLNFISGL